MFSFTLEKNIGTARAGKFQTPHGVVHTPIYMPVGTHATVKALDNTDLLLANAPIILANTYHLYLRPGIEALYALGGLHTFMHWDKPILTDSGGFQVFSLGLQQKQFEKRLSNITDNGVRFTSHLDGSRHEIGPKKAIEIQRILGSDIMMVFDECTPNSAGIVYAREALDRTHRWAKQCKAYWEEHKRKNAYGTYQALFGIVQGALHKALRQESVRVITNMDFDGIAVGGETIGYNMEGTQEVMRWIEHLLPKNKPRYAMGLGKDPEDIIHAVRIGFDMFDCVAPTRMARNGALYQGYLSGSTPETWKFESEFPKGRLQIGNNQWRTDQKPIMSDCDCWTCAQGYSKAYLCHLYHAKELTYYRLASIHNIRFMIRLTEQLREKLLQV